MRRTAVGAQGRCARYAADDPGGMFAELLVDQRRHADRLLEALRARLADGDR